MNNDGPIGDVLWTEAPDAAKARLLLHAIVVAKKADRTRSVEWRRCDHSSGGSLRRVLGYRRATHATASRADRGVAARADHLRGQRIRPVAVEQERARRS